MISVVAKVLRVLKVLRVRRIGQWTILLLGTFEKPEPPEKLERPE